MINNSKHAQKETSQEEQEHRDSDSDVEMGTVVEGDTQEETESETDGTQSLEFDVDGTSETVLEQQEGWTVPSKEELDLCAAHWISDLLDILSRKLTLIFLMVLVHSLSSMIVVISHLE